MSFLRKLARGIVCAASMLVPASSYAENLEVKKVHLTSCVNDEPCTNRNKDVRLEDRVRLNLVVEGDVDGRRTFFSEEDNVEINGRKVRTRKPGESLDAAVRWYKVEPAENSYNNIRNGRFVWDTPAYTENLDWSTNLLVKNADSHPTDSTRDVNGGLGTMRYKAEVVHNGVVYATPGKESADNTGIKDDVHRITFRDGDDFLGWLSAYFNVPYIYGSAEKKGRHQTDRFVGADCADLVTGACRKSGGNMPYTNAAGLRRFSDIIAKQEELDMDDMGVYRKNGGVLRYDKDVRRGDLILFGNWHVGVLGEDANGDGILDREDQIVHTFFDLPKSDPIGDYREFSILRLKCR